MMGVKIRRRGRKWYVFVDYQGKRKAKCVGTRAAAEQVRQKLEAKLTLGDFSFLKSEKPASFADYVKTWEKQYVDLKPSTIARYKGLLKLHILPYFGSKAIDSITRDDVKRFFSELVLKQVQPKSKDPDKINPNRKTLSASSLQNALICLRVVLQGAVEDGLLTVNPASKVGRFLPKDPEKFEAVFLTGEELERFLSSIRALNPEHYPLFLTFARTGMRLGEALALRWGDIQFGGDTSDTNRFFWIRRNYTAGSFVTPKSDKARRVDMSQQLRTVLLSLREQRLLHAMLKDEGPISEDLVFPSPTGAPLDPANLNKRVLSPAIQHAGLRRFGIQFREAYAIHNLRISPFLCHRAPLRGQKFAK
jgi:integrase